MLTYLTTIWLRAKTRPGSHAWSESHLGDRSDGRIRSGSRPWTGALAEDPRAADDETTAVAAAAPPGCPATRQDRERAAGAPCAHEPVRRRPVRELGLALALLLLAMPAAHSGRALSPSSRHRLSVPTRGRHSNAAVAGSQAQDAGALLDDIQKRAIRYFWNEADPDTGLVADRARNFTPAPSSPAPAARSGTAGAASKLGSPSQSRPILSATPLHRSSPAAGLPSAGSPPAPRVASIAATGFGLAALVVAADQGRMPRRRAEARALATLRFFARRAPQVHGFYYHFLDMRSGARAWKCELSTIDSAILLLGALAAGSYFHGEAARLARGLYERMDFRWALTDGGARPQEQTLAMGWKPETGFLRSRWRSFDEALLLEVLALGAPHPIPRACWNAWQRPVANVGHWRGVGLSMPLFVHQYPEAFLDLRGLSDDRGLDYWRNSRAATLANRWYCASHAAMHRGYGPNGWGVSASDGPSGYRGYAPAAGRDDGTLNPCVVAAAVPVVPKKALACLRAMAAQGGLPIRGRYGWSAFNADRGWVDPDVLGIDLGGALLMLANRRDGVIWRSVMRWPQVRRGLRAAGLEHRSAEPMAGWLG